MKGERCMLNLIFSYSLLTLELLAGQETNQRKEGGGHNLHNNVILVTVQDHVPESECGLQK